MDNAQLADRWLAETIRKIKDEYPTVTDMEIEFNLDPLNRWDVWITELTPQAMPFTVGETYTIIGAGQGETMSEAVMAAWKNLSEPNLPEGQLSLLFGEVKI